MAPCSARKCKYRHGKGPNPRSIHRFPLNKPEILQMWLHNLGKKNWLPTKHSIVCSNHFEEHCFITIGKKCGRNLKEDAIPTLLLQPESSKRKSSFIWMPEDIPTTTCNTFSPNKFLRNRVINNNLTTESNQIISPAIKQEVSSEDYVLSECTTDKLNNEFLPFQIENIRSLNYPNGLPSPTTNLNKEFQIPKNSLENLDVTSEKCNIEHSSIKYSLPNDSLTMNLEKTSIKEPHAPILKPGVKMRYIKVLPETLLTSSILMARGKLDRTVIKMEEYKKTLKAKNQKIRRLSKKVEKLKDEIKDHQRINCKNFIQDCFSGLHLDFILGMLNDKKSNQAFTESIRSFVSKLYSLSPKAYEYVQSEFENSLPSPSLVQHWQQVENCHALEENKHSLKVPNELHLKDGCILSQNNNNPIINCVSKNNEQIQLVINHLLDNICVNES